MAIKDDLEDIKNKMGNNMNKTINNLENERKEKIKDLNLDEVKAYITNLNKKVFKSFNENNHEDVIFYNDKLKEVFDLTSDKFVNLDLYSLLRRFEISTSMMIESNTKIEIIDKTLLSIFLIGSFTTLQELYFHLEWVLMIYYHNYYTKDNMLVDDLLVHLHCDYGFNNTEFDELAYSKVRKYNGILMSELDTLIGNLKTHAKHIIRLTDDFVNENYKDEISIIFKRIEYEKEFVNKKSESEEGIRTLKEGEYLELLDSMKESYVLYGESCAKYIRIKKKILDLIDSPDGFLSMKEDSYDYAKKYGLSSSKKDYIASRPSYNMSKCEFIKSG